MRLGQTDTYVPVTPSRIRDPHPCTLPAKLRWFEQVNSLRSFLPPCLCHHGGRCCSR